ncbi:MAG TPA: M90 family metallopeptidase [Ilumatobacteraceae bacterium]|nr:M90 family metallopeptidase [Ilumatobacteraceae bacterium]
MARRKHLPDDWESIVQRGVAYWQLLNREERERLVELADFIVANKRWEAARGFELTDDVVVTIAMEAAVLILGLDTSYFGKVTTIIVHPTTFSIPGPHATDILGMVDAGPRPLLGEAHHDRGPTLLAWDQVRSAARHRGRGRNVVWHEFAHKLDMLDGVVDGTPLMQDREALDRWIDVCAAELALLRSGESGHLIDPYAATDPGEFFAVTTEVFFDLPLELRAQKRELYEVLAGFYRQDPASREPVPASWENP